MIQLASLLGIAGILKVARAVIPYVGSPFLPSPHQYVVITGCTDGIGKQYAKYMSSRGVPLVLVGRNLHKLSHLLQELGGDRHRIMQIDYSKEGADENVFNQGLEKLQIPQQSISGFINCCGAAFVGKYADLSWKEIQQIKRVNTNCLQLALKATTTKLVSNQCFFINLSSYTSHYPLKYSSVYSGTKAYMTNLLLAWAEENKHIRALSVEPWYVTTKMTGFRKGWDCVEATQVVDGSLRALGRRTRCAGTIKHELLHEFSYLLQKFYFPSIIEQNYQRVAKLKELRQRRNRKQEDQEKEKDGEEKK